MIVGHYKNYLYTTDKVSSEKNNNNNEESQYMVSHPETGSDSPIGSDQDRGRDTTPFRKCTGHTSNKVDSRSPDIVPTRIV